VGASQKDFGLRGDKFFRLSLDEIRVGCGTPPKIEVDVATLDPAERRESFAQRFDMGRRFRIAAEGGSLRAVTRAG
jgi:hypothetical protein